MGQTDDGRQAAQLDRIRKEADQLPQGTAEQPMAPDIPPDRTRRFRSVNFSRMRTEWGGEDKIKVAEIGRIADQVMAQRFADAYWLLERVHRVVREPLITGSGEPVRDLVGHPRWRRNEMGFYIEDWSRLGDAQRNDLLHELAIHLFEWRQQADALVRGLERLEDMLLKSARI